MEIKIDIPIYSIETGFKFDWEDGFKIKVESSNDIINIIANKEGLISLAKQLLTLAQDEVPKGYHIHLDEFNSLEDESSELIIEKS